MILRLKTPPPSIYANVTDRITLVTKRFFLFFAFFVTLQLHETKPRQKGQKMKDQITKNNGKKLLFLGFILVAAFSIWTALIQLVDVRPLGQNGTNIGLATFNTAFHKLTGVYMSIYTITDWLGLIPVFICMIFAGLGFIQLVKRRSLFKVDYDIIFLGIYYVIVIACYLLFEMFPINYRPILIDGFMEASYPSSTTLLVLCVMPTLTEQINRRLENKIIKKFINIFVILFSVFMVLGRLISGIHWFTDIIGGILLSSGLFCIYKASVLLGAKLSKNGFTK